MEGDRCVEDRNVLQEAIQEIAPIFSGRIAARHDIDTVTGRHGDGESQNVSASPCLPVAPSVVPHFANGNTGSISTGTSFNLSSACCIGGLIKANLSRIALALSYDPSA